MRKSAKDLKRFLTDDNGKLRGDRVAAFNTECQEGRHGLSSYSIKDLAQTFLGKDVSGELRHVSLRESTDLLEAGGMTVNSTAFPQITGQLLFSEIRAGFDLEANVFTPIVPVVPSIIKGTEIVPSITCVDPDDIESVLEGQAYPRIGVTEEYFTLPAKVKKGAIIEVTREAIALDKTGMLVGQAQSLGRAHGQTRENEIIDCLIGQTNNYSRNGTATNTYLTTGAYVNNQSSAVLSDWTDVESAVRLFDAILDPNTSEPLASQVRHLIVSPAKLMTAARILAATGTQHDSDHAEPLNEKTLGHNPIANLGLTLLSSIRLNRRVLAGPEAVQANADAGWWLGNLSELLKFYEVWPLALMQKGAESEASFDRDVTLQFKSTHYGVCAVVEPRYMTRNEDTAW